MLNIVDNYYESEETNSPIREYRSPLLPLLIVFAVLAAIFSAAGQGTGSPANEANTVSMSSSYMSVAKPATQPADVQVSTLAQYDAAASTDSNAPAAEPAPDASSGGIPLQVQVISPIVDNGAAPSEAQAVNDAQPGSQTADQLFNVTLAGSQPEIDKCAGPVDVSAFYGLPALAEHWACGGSYFPRWKGATVRLTGLKAGLYRVEGVIGYLNGGKDKVDVVPRGYDLIFQTCLQNDATHSGLMGMTRIGD